MQEAAQRLLTSNFLRYALLWTRTKNMPFLLPKPMPDNLNHGNDRFSMFNKSGTSPFGERGWVSPARWLEVFDIGSLPTTIGTSISAVFSLKCKHHRSTSIDR
jgi:hypothetical protein